MPRNNSSHYRDIFLNDTPMMDMRAPIEFAQGAFPTSQTHPLMLDDERAAVGTCYKQQGQAAAIALGHRLVCGAEKEARVAQWKVFCEAHPEGYLYCFRGGLRSRISQQWLQEAGIDYPFIEGGYKALRRFLLDTIDTLSEQPLTVVSGCTGNGKTTLINSLHNGIDLEGAANHRGSSFGRYVSSAHNQISFDNRLAVDLLKKQAAGCGSFVTEDEGRNIGSVGIPLLFFKAMQRASIAVIEDPLDVRLARLLDDYICRMQRDFVSAYGETEGWLQFAVYLEKGLFSVRKRLGNERYQHLLTLQQRALQLQQRSGSVDAHLDWLTLILKEYYDPMYQYQLAQKADRIIYRGQYDEVQAWLIARGNCQ